MEWFLALFVTHDTYVVSFLVVAIAIIIVLLLVYTQKSPESVVKSEVAGADNIEGALRRVLGEKSWVGTQTGGGESSARLGELESEVLEKDRTIAELNKQLTQGGGGAGGDDSELMARINDLEARLQEYEIIEDDIADLSLYKTENDKLKEELARLKAQAGMEVDSAEEAEPEIRVSAPEAAAPEESSVADDTTNSSESPEPFTKPAGSKVEAADLVAEFEKVVNNQEMVGGGDDAGEVSVADEPDVSPGAVSMAATPEVHPKLKDVPPDSKEEAEIFINELKSLKKTKPQEES